MIFKNSNYSYWIDTALSLLVLLLLSTISTVCGQNGEIITQVLTRKRKAIIFFSLLFTVRHQKLYDQILYNKMISFYGIW